jgi:hypothetical protein
MPPFCPPIQHGSFREVPDLFDCPVGWSWPAACAAAWRAACGGLPINPGKPATFRLLGRFLSDTRKRETAMGFGRGLLLWLIGIPIPIIILIALLMHH